MQLQSPSPHCSDTIRSIWGFFLLTFRFGVAQDFGHIGIDGVLSQSSHDLPTLAVADLPISNLVKQQERFLILYRMKTHAGLWIGTTTAQREGGADVGEKERDSELENRESKNS